MAIIVDPTRDQAIRQQLETAFLRHRRDASLKPSADEVELDSSWTLLLEGQETPLLRRSGELFRRFMSHCMQVSFAPQGERHLVFRLDAGLGGGEDATVEVQRDRIVVTAGHEKGLQSAAMRLLRTFADRQAPFLMLGSHAYSPRFSPRITSTVFYTSDLKLSDIDEAFPHDYLALMAFFGITGIFWEIDFYDYCNSEVLPELRCPDYADNVRRLNAVVERLAEYGIGLHFLYSVRVLPADHPVFAAHPEVAGAHVVVGKEEDGHCLCSSSEQVLRYYEDSLATLHRDVPGLAGPILLVGGERFTHCYTRPTPPLTNKTNCPRCCTIRPAEGVASMVNRIAAAVKQVAPDVHIFCWPYSAFTWSGPEDNYQLELLRHLSEDVSSLANFSTGEFCSSTGALLGDYNIMLPEASNRFQAQAAELRSQGKPIFAKAECSTTPFMFHVPYLPVMYRWARRAKALRENHVKGVFYHYRYYGFTGSLADELALESVWHEVDTDSFLERYCRREYGEFAPGMLDGWRQLSEAWGTIPYSMALSGERQYYVKGPIYLGPAHPFIFTVQNDYGLRRGFTRIRGSVLFPEVPDEERERLSSPAYASDLMFTWPLGAEKCQAALQRTAEAWTAGAEAFAQSFQQPNENAARDIGICKLIGSHFRTAYNLVRFYRQRDAFLSNGGPDSAYIETALAELAEILTAEIANSRAALELLDKDPRLGYGYSYGIVYDRRMIEEKIRQCQYVLDVEMPKLGAGLRFHMFGVYP